VDMRTDPAAVRKEINRLNRQRGKQLENDVSTLFLGNRRGRIAYSGAGYEKGDCKISLPNDGGAMYVECKCRDLKHPKLGPGAKVEYKWFDKLQYETVAMQGRLGVLALRFFHQPGIYIFFRMVDIPILESVSGNSLQFSGPIIDGRFSKVGKPFVAYTLFRNFLLEQFKLAGVGDTAPNCQYATSGGTYVIVEANEFKRFVGYPV
jgi:hypothetical protein